MHSLTKLGYDSWVQSHAESQQIAPHELARVVSVHRESYILSKGGGDVFAELTGNLLYTAQTSLELPTAGDWVWADFYDDDSHAIIHEVIPRKTLLKRKTSGKAVEYQLIGANIDIAFIVQAVDDNLNMNRLERYLVMVHESSITPVILLSKCDLISNDLVDDVKGQISAVSPGTEVIAFSNLSEESTAPIRDTLCSGQTYCLLGSSGVGKTSLLNNIMGSEAFVTQEVSKRRGKGKHTTTRRELVQLPGGALLLDTPGMRELGNIAIDIGLDETFAEIVTLSDECRFSDCSHQSEKGCAVLAAIKDGRLPEKRYRNYLKMRSESAFYEMSYSEKRKKDKAFGKMIKSTMKSKKRW
ncbi:ribosome small subunit-dependent GTPase A [Desulforhopalus sp. 52FAK]